MPSKIALQKKLLRREALSRNFAPRVYDDESGLYILDDNVVGFGFMFTPMVHANDGVAKNMTLLFNKWMPDNAMVQFSLYPSEDVFSFTENMRYLCKSKQRKNKESGALLDEFAEQRAKFLEEGVGKPIEKIFDTQARVTMGYLTVSFPADHKTWTEEFADRVLELKDAMQENLETSGMGPRLLDPQNLKHIFSTIINTGDESAWRKGRIEPYIKEKFINEQIPDGDTKFERVADDVMWVGSPKRKRYVKVLSAKRFPPRASINNSFLYAANPLDKGRGMLGSFIMTQTIFFPARKKEKLNLDKMRAWSNNQRPLARWNPILSKVADSFDLINASMVEGNRPVRVAMNLTIFGDSERDVQTRATNAINYFAGAELDFTFQEETILLPGMFNFILPFGGDPNPAVVNMMERFIRTTTDVATQMLPICGEWKGNGDPVMQIVGMSGELMSIDLWGSDTNMNGLMSAASGSGKSVAGQTLVISNMAFADAQVYVVDIGHSYKRICEMFGGNYFEFESKDTYNFSPFSAVSSIEEDIDMVAGIIEIMVAQKSTLSDFELSLMKEAIKEAWAAKGNEAIIDDVYNALATKASGDRIIYELAFRLKEFTSKGSYGKYFSGDKKAEMSGKQLNVFEVGGLNGQDTLQAVILFMILAEIKKRVFKDMLDPEKRERRKLIVIDEGWQMLLKGLGAMKEFYRTFRKANASIMLITQSLLDIVNEGGEGARTIIDNSANKYFLGMESATVEAIQRSKLLSLSGLEWEMLKNLQSQKGHFSELFFMTNRGNGQGRLILGDFLQLLTSSSAEDAALIERVKRDMGPGTTDGQAIARIVENRKRDAQITQNNKVA